MVCKCCIRVLRQILEQENIQVLRIGLGQATISYNAQQICINHIKNILSDNGMEMIMGHEQKIVEQIKVAVIELVHQMNNMDSIVRKSDYLVEKLGMSYAQLSRIFSRYESITLERFIILHKIERIKGLIDSDEYTLSEIAYMMDYSSVQYLSTQFKKVTGVTVTQYKNGYGVYPKPLDTLC